MDSWDTIALLADLAETQRAHLTREQAVANGVTWPTLKELENARVIVQVLPGVYRMRGSASDGARDALYAWWLSLNPKRTPGSFEAHPLPVVSHAAAAYWYGVMPQSAYRRECIVPGSFSAPAGAETAGVAVELHRAELASNDWRWEDGLPVTTPLRTFVDLFVEFGAGVELARVVHHLESSSLLEREQLVSALEPFAVAEECADGADLLDFISSQAFQLRRRQRGAHE